jgi:hypothetical protein
MLKDTRSRLTILKPSRVRLKDTAQASPALGDNAARHATLLATAVAFYRDVAFGVQLVGFAPGPPVLLLLEP